VWSVLTAPPTSTPDSTHDTALPPTAAHIASIDEWEASLRAKHEECETASLVGTETEDGSKKEKTPNIFVAGTFEEVLRTANACLATCLETYDWEKSPPFVALLEALQRFAQVTRQLIQVVITSRRHAAPTTDADAVDPETHLPKTIHLAPEEVSLATKELGDTILQALIWLETPVPEMRATHSATFHREMRSSGNALFYSDWSSSITFSTDDVAIEMGVADALWYAFTHTILVQDLIDGVTASVCITDVYDDALVSQGAIADPAVVPFDLPIAMWTAEQLMHCILKLINAFPMLRYTPSLPGLLELIAFGLARFTLLPWPITIWNVPFLCDKLPYTNVLDKKGALYGPKMIWVIWMRHVMVELHQNVAAVQLCLGFEAPHHIHLPAGHTPAVSKDDESGRGLELELELEGEDGPSSSPPPPAATATATPDSHDPMPEWASDAPPWTLTVFAGWRAVIEDSLVRLAERGSQQAILYTYEQRVADIFRRPGDVTFDAIPGSGFLQWHRILNACAEALGTTVRDAARVGQVSIPRGVFCTGLRGPALVSVTRPELLGFIRIMALTPATHVIVTGGSTDIPPPDFVAMVEQAQGTLSRTTGIDASLEATAQKQHDVLKGISAAPTAAMMTKKIEEAEIAAKQMAVARKAAEDAPNALIGSSVLMGIPRILTDTIAAADTIKKKGFISGMRLIECGVTTVPQLEAAWNAAVPSPLGMARLRFDALARCLLTVRFDPELQARSTRAQLEAYIAQMGTPITLPPPDADGANASTTKDVWAQRYLWSGADIISAYPKLRTWAEQGPDFGTFADPVIISVLGFYFIAGGGSGPGFVPHVSLTSALGHWMWIMTTRMDCRFNRHIESPTLSLFRAAKIQTPGTDSTEAIRKRGQAVLADVVLRSFSMSDKVCVDAF
jgi:hypothetical protein